MPTATKTKASEQDPAEPAVDGLPEGDESQSE